MKVSITPTEALTADLDLPALGRISLHLLVTLESGALYIRCLDFGVMSSGESVEECKENIREAILIYLEDLPVGQSLFKPAPAPYWRMFYDLLADRDRQVVGAQRQPTYPLKVHGRNPEISPSYLRGIIEEYTLPADAFDL